MAGEATPIVWQRLCRRNLSSTSGYLARGLWSRMQAPLRRFMPRMPSSRRRRAAVNSQNMPPPSWSVRDFQRGRRWGQEVAEAKQLAEAITRVTADQQLGCHHQAERLGEA